MGFNSGFKGLSKKISKCSNLYIVCILVLHSDDSGISYRNMSVNNNRYNKTWFTDVHLLRFFFCCGAATQRGSWPPLSRGFLDHTQRRTTVGRTPLDEWSARRRDLYLTTHNTHNRQISMPPVGFETHDLSRRAAADLHLRPRGHWNRLLVCYAA